MKTSVHAIARRCYKHRLGSLSRTFLYQLVFRLLAIAPAACALVLKYPLRHGLIASLLLYILLVLPERFCAATHMARMTRQAAGRSLHVSPYFSRLCAGMIRLGLGLLWGLPCFFFAYRTYQYVFVFPGTRFSQDFAAFGALLSPGADALMQGTVGTLAYFALLILSFFLFLYGWHRGVAYDFQMVGNVSPLRALKTARRVRRRVRWQLWRNALINSLIFLPAVVIPLLIPYLKLTPLLTGRAMEDLQLIFVFLSAGMISDGTLLLLLAAFIVLYFPLLPYRKLRNAAVVVNCYGPDR